MGAILLEHLPEQDEFYHCEDDVCAFVGALGCGKTFTAVDKLLTGFAEYPKARHFIFSNTYDQLRAGTLNTFFEELHEKWAVDPRFACYEDRVHTFKEIRFPKLGGKIEVRSVDKEINWKSLEICRAWIDEAQAWPKKAYDMVIGRLRGTGTQRQLYPNMKLQVFITANPPHTHAHWLYPICHDIVPRLGRPRVKLFTSTTYDNPFLPQDYIERMEDQFDPDIAEAELLGKFINLGRGQVFRKFLRAKHFLTKEEALAQGLPPLEYDPNQPIAWSHDFNYDPLCSVLFQWRRVNVPGYQKVVMYVIDSMRIEGALISDAPRELYERRSISDAWDIAKNQGLILYGDASGNFGPNRQTGKVDWVALEQELRRVGLRVAEKRVRTANPTHKDRSDAANRMLINTRGEIGVVILNDGPRGNNRWMALDIEKMVWTPGSFKIEIERPKPGEVLPLANRMTHLGDAWSYPIEHDFGIKRKDRGDINLQR